MSNRLPAPSSYLTRSGRHTPYTLVVLCGGQGSRLGGADKGLLPCNGTRFASQLIERLADKAGHGGSHRVLISANRNHALYAATGYRVISDLRGCFQGPLAGIEACLQAIPKGPVVIVPADMPELPADLPGRLLARLTCHSIAIAHDGNHPQPLCMALYAERWKDSLRCWLDQGGRSVQQWLSNKPVTEVMFKQTAQFCNINDYDDLIAFKQRQRTQDAQMTLIGYDQRHDHQSCQ